MTNYTIHQLFNIGVISKRLKQVLSLLRCATFKDMIALSKDKIRVDYLERSHHLKDELFKAISDINNMDDILPELVKTTTNTDDKPIYSITSHRKKKFKVSDYTEELLQKSDVPINQDDLLKEIKKYLPDTYVDSIRANLNGDPQKRFVFFLDGYIGLKSKTYDSRYQLYSIKNKKIQYAENRIMEFLSFLEDKHRSPQPHGLEEEESLYRWYLDFIKSSSKELSGLRATFKEYLKEYDKWMFTPYEYSYKRNCDQVKWYVDKNLELPTPDEEQELSTWFNSQLENYVKYKDKRKEMFIDLINFLADYGLHFYDTNSINTVSTKKIEEEPVEVEEDVLNKYIRLFKSFRQNEKGKKYAIQKALLILAIGNLVQKNKIKNNEISLNDDLLTEFADVCIDIVGTASSYNIAIPYYYMSEEPFWNLINKKSVVCEDIDEHEITFDYIENTISYSRIDDDLFEVLSDNESFNQLKESLIYNVIKGEDDSVFDYQQPVPNKSYSKIRIEDYGKRSIGVVGEFNAYTDYFKSMGGYLKYSSKFGPIWLFPKKSRKKLEELLFEEVNAQTTVLHISEPEPSVGLDIFKTIFKNRVTSYKFLWLLAIISLLKENIGRNLSYTQIVIRMVAIAWPLVLKEGIHFNKVDRIPEFIKYLQSFTRIPEDANSAVVDNMISQHYFNMAKIYLSPLLANVPYRFLSPWIPYTNKDDVIRKSQQSTFTGPYILGDAGIKIRKEWELFFKTHYDEVWDLTCNFFLYYVKQYNSDFESLSCIRNLQWSKQDSKEEYSSKGNKNQDALKNVIPHLKLNTREIIRVEYPDGRIISHKHVYETLIDVIKYADPKKVHDLNIICMGENLVSETLNSNNIYRAAQKEIGNGLYVSTYSSTDIKYKQIQKINASLHLGLKVEKVASDGGEVVKTKNDYKNPYFDAIKVNEDLEVEHVYLDSKGNVVETKMGSYNEESNKSVANEKTNIVDSPSKDSRIGYKVKLFPSQFVGEIVDVKIGKWGQKRLVVVNPKGEIKESDDTPYLYEVLKKK